MDHQLNRRAMLALSAGTCLGPRLVCAAEGKRELDIRVNPAGFGDASAADILAVVKSSAGEIWKHCPDTEFRLGMQVYFRKAGPITLTKHSDDDRIQIGLAVEGTYSAQFAYQFAHEFAHALAGHSNDWRKCWQELSQANKWLEESLCEAASLFALRRMAETWKTDAPYPNWKSFAPKLTDYASQRLGEPMHKLPANTSFSEWFRAEERSLRKDPTQRAKNTIIARQLLPIFEAMPSGWEAITALNLGERDATKELAKHCADWKKAAGEKHAKFITRVGAELGVAVS